MRLRVLSEGAIIIFMIAPFVLSQSHFTILGGRSYPANYNSASDPSLFEKNLNTDTLPRRDTKFHMKKSPAIAVLLSAVLPGAGQFYNQSYWKTPIFLGLTFYFGYEYVDNNKKFNDYKDQYNATITPENPFGDQYLKTLREFYRNQRDDFVWYFIVVYFINLVDAYVDAHLFDFDVKEEKITHLGKMEKTYRLKFNLKL